MFWSGVAIGAMSERKVKCCVGVAGTTAAAPSAQRSATATARGAAATTSAFGLLPARLSFPKVILSLLTIFGS